MRRKFFNLAKVATLLLMSVVFIASCKKSDTGNGGITPIVPVTPPKDTTTKPTDTTKYTLVWSDEFDGDKVDESKWNFETGNLNVNNEKEYYQSQNATVSGGNLVITAKQESVGGQPYTSARLNTLNKFSQLYGRIEARIKIPLGAGMWPAFWAMGANLPTVSWPTCGELDIMEHVNADNIFYGTMHWNKGGHVSYGLTTTETDPAAYHVYAIEWDKNSIRWYIDKTLYMTGNIQDDINNTSAFHFPFFILLNLAVAGDFPGQTVDTSILPAAMYVDYVRVYKAG